MKRIRAGWLVVFVLSFWDTNRVVAQGLTVSQFLNSVSAHPAGDEAEFNRSMDIAEEINSAPPAEVVRDLPAILAHTASGNEVSVRGYAAKFLLAIALRSDGAQLLSSSSGQVAALLLDTNPEIQNTIVAVTDYVIGHAETNTKPYLTAMETAIRRPQAAQDVGAGIVGPLLFCGSSDPAAVESVLDFMRRPDLTSSTRAQLVHSLGSQGGLPTEVNRALVRELDDPDPRVRIEAVVAFADSTTEYHALAKDRVAQMANDTQEDPRVRELAKEAIAGKTRLNPNIGLPQPENPPRGRPNQR